MSNLNNDSLARLAELLDEAKRIVAGSPSQEPLPMNGNEEDTWELLWREAARLLVLARDRRGGNVYLSMIIGQDRRWTKSRPPSTSSLCGVMRGKKSQSGNPGMKIDRLKMIVEILTDYLAGVQELKT